MPSVSLHIPVAIILLGGGLLACFLGYRLLRVLLAVYGFVGGVMVGTLFTDELTTWVAVLVIVGGGLIGSVLSFVAYLAGVALAGAALAAFAVHAVWARVERVEGEPIFWVVLTVCLAGALVSLALRRYVIIVGTSFGGAWSTIVGGLALAGNTAAVAGASGDVLQLYPLVSANGHMGFVLGWVGLGALPTLIQLCTTSRAWVQKSSKKS